MFDASLRKAASCGYENWCGRASAQKVPLKRVRWLGGGFPAGQRGRNVTMEALSGRHGLDSALFQCGQRAEHVPTRTAKQHGHPNSRRPARSQPAHPGPALEPAVDRLAAGANPVVFGKRIGGLFGSPGRQATLAGRVGQDELPSDLSHRAL